MPPIEINNAAILLVEDHRALADTIIANLEQSGFIMDYADNGITALQLAEENHYDAIILDIMMPGINGLNVCQQLRESKELDVPIIMLTALDQIEDKVAGLQKGADDYLVKPFDFAELEARVIALIRRYRRKQNKKIFNIHDLVFNAETLEVVRADQKIKLSPTGVKILQILLRESPTIVSRETLEREVWGDLLPDSDTLRSHLYNLRKAIDKPFEKPLLHTIPNIGFKIVAPED